MNLTTDTIEGLIYTLEDIFAVEYYNSVNIQVDQKFTPLYNGYCFYFAKTLYNLIKGSVICLCQNHYVIKYNGEYYDFRGQIAKNSEGLNLWYNLTLPFDKIIEAEDCEKEENMASLSGIVDKEKDQVWESFEPKLLEAGKNYLKDALGRTR